MNFIATIFFKRMLFCFFSLPVIIHLFQMINRKRKREFDQDTIDDITEINTETNSSIHSTATLSLSESISTQLAEMSRIVNVTPKSNPKSDSSTALITTQNQLCVLLQMSKRFTQRIATAERLYRFFQIIRNELPSVCNKMNIPSHELHAIQNYFMMNVTPKVTPPEFHNTMVQLSFPGNVHLELYRGEKIQCHYTNHCSLTTFVDGWSDTKIPYDDPLNNDSVLIDMTDNFSTNPFSRERCRREQYLQLYRFRTTCGLTFGPNISNRTVLIYILYTMESLSDKSHVRSDGAQQAYHDEMKALTRYSGYECNEMIHDTMIRTVTQHLTHKAKFEDMNIIHIIFMFLQPRELVEYTSEQHIEALANSCPLFIQ